MIRYLWLASFPRSGNTFIRNIFHHVYGLNSLEGEEEVVDTDSSDFVLVKTHELPFRTKLYSPKKDKVIYIVRDGRDSICSLAFKRKRLIAPDSDLALNFEEATYASKGSFFGGWYYNCLFWLAEKPIFIRFEDLTKDPQKVFLELEKQIPLPKANWDRLPTFEQQKSGMTKFGAQGDAHPDVNNFSKLFFRKGGIGNWKTEMPTHLQEVFWDKSSEMMMALGYRKDGAIEKIDAQQLNKLVGNKLSLFLIRIKLHYWSIQVKYIALKQKLKSSILN